VTLRLAPGLVLLGSASGIGLGISAWMVRAMADRQRRSAGDVPAVPVAIVPGARVLDGDRPSAVLEHRLAAALELHGAGSAGRILISGNAREVRVMRRWLRQHGLAEDLLLGDALGTRTRETMQRARRVFGVRRAAVCTQAFHLPRALYLARQAGIDAVGLVADVEGYRPSRATRLRELLARQKAFFESPPLPWRR
jgi:SanA protein